MSTIYKRLTHFCTRQKISLPDIEKRKEIGKEVVDAWFSPTNKIKLPLHYHVFLDEHGNPQRVLSYPKIFNPVIDKIIERNIAPPISKVKKKKPVYSYKPKC